LIAAKPAASAEFPWSAFAKFSRRATTPAEEQHLIRLRLLIRAGGKRLRRRIDRESRRQLQLAAQRFDAGLSLGRSLSVGVRIADDIQLLKPASAAPCSRGRGASASTSSIGGCGCICWLI
jgi:hypothetical protein